MMRSAERGRFLVVAMVLAALGSAAGELARAQEPAFLNNTMVARYEEAPGYFHYVSPCALPVGDEKLSAICWPALLGKIDMVDGKAKFSTPVSGLMMVSASLVRLVPDDAKGPAPMADRKPAEIQAGYNVKQVFELLHTPEGYYGFAIRAFCRGCTAGKSPIDVTKVAQLTAEYGEFEGSLQHFDGVLKRIAAIAANVRVSVTPKNQPGPDDVAPAMGLYSEVNTRLAKVCAEPAKACVRQYAEYQACKSGNATAECGSAPSCSAACALGPAEMRTLKAIPCTSRDGDSMALGPDWTPVAVKMDAAGEARKRAEAAQGGPTAADASPVKAAPNMDGKRLDFMGKPVDDSNPCSVEEQYAMAMMVHTMPFGGIGAFPVGAQTGGAPMVDGATGQVRISGGTMAGRMVSRVNPVYPAVAKAARISGAVVMTAVISKTGDISDLSVESGPELLRAPALEAVRQWKYRPYLLLDKPVEVHTTITVNFNFGDGGPVPGAAGTAAAPTQ